MSDDEVDHDLLALLRKSLGMSNQSENVLTSDTGVLSDAEYIYNNSVDVAIDMVGTKTAAAMIWKQMQSRGYSTRTWSEHELHPKAKDEATVDFIFVMDLLNFSFWSEKEAEERYAVEYRGRRWTGYWSLVACLQRALDEEVPITTPSFYASETLCPDSTLSHVFRSSTSEPIPLLQDRISCLRQAGTILQASFNSRVLDLVSGAEGSAGKLVNLLAKHFPCFDDRARFDGREVRIMKRAQIFVADLWAKFEGVGYGGFGDVEGVTMFADYRVPQILHSLHCISYSPPLTSAIRALELLESGSAWEVQLRGCSIWCVELIRREILKLKMEREDGGEAVAEGGNVDEDGAEVKVNAILIDFFLYDLAKEREKEALEREKEDAEESGGAGADSGAAGFVIPHHRCRSIWY